MCATAVKNTSYTIDQSNITINLGMLVFKGPKELRIQQQINEHASIYFKKMLTEAEISKYQELVEQETPILVRPESNKGNRLAPDCPEVLFQGIATKIDVYHDTHSGNDYLEVFGLSYTYKLDITKRSRSFQNKQMTLRQMVNQVLESYSVACCNIDNRALDAKTLGKFTLQHKETDWIFLKRQASVHGHSYLIADATVNFPLVNMGTKRGSKKRELDHRCKLNYTITKTMDGTAALERKRLEQGMADDDRWYFTFSGTHQIYEIGDSVTFLEKVLYVCRVTAELTGSNLKFGYVMTTADGLQYPALYNEPLLGRALDGKIKAIQNNRVKVELNIDHDSKKPFDIKTACWFPYATPYTAGGQWGWYFMPELEDEIQLHFPANREEEAYVSHSVRAKQTENTDSPQIKYLRTKDGQELHFGPTEIKIIAGEQKTTYINLTEEEIFIQSNQNIALKADENILIAADGKVNITGKAGVEMSCQGSSVRLLGGSTHMRASKKMNDHRVGKAEAKKLNKSSPLKDVFLPEVSIKTKSNRRDVICNEAKALGIDPDFLEAVIMTESNGSGFSNGKLIIRFEAHRFNKVTKKKYSKHFTYDSEKPWTKQQFREDVSGENWEWIHPTKNQQKQEYRVLDYAKGLDEESAYQSISMGLGQIMGDQYASLDYSSAKEMYEAFSQSEDEQIKGMVKWMKSNQNALNALKQESFGDFVTAYNGPGKVADYTGKFENNLKIIKKSK